MVKIDKKIIIQALEEDRAAQDITTKTLIPAEGIIEAELTIKQDGVLCGLDVVREVFCTLNKKCSVTPFAKDGDRVQSGQIVAKITGPSQAILSAERTALNFIQHLSGIATLTNLFVQKIKGTQAEIYDTRKTLPGLRRLEKYAVRCGGGNNHRMDLQEMAMLKDNHLRMVSDLKTAMAKLRKAKRGIRIELECQNMQELEHAIEAGADIIMLDNMSVPMMRKAIALIKKNGSNGKRPRIEISGGVNIKTVRTFAELGVDMISIGAITHSAPALDISLEIISL